ncbi:sugar phosphate isomerase/epimerase family protein [Candidatus Pelagibacter bacterium nBUS_44]|uniref:sugar phosphate isomerase/epimerase family protein n=1 Tax=Candidatus Pelagibacter bacterium nBUS_44 TaxID=3374195 RepID=UPI003EB6FDDA
MKINIGYMQGRLLSDNTDKIQNFPDLNWKNELFIANKIDFKLVEWTINKNNINKNPLYNNKLDELKRLSKKFKIKINSVTCDYFMEDCFFKKKNYFRKKKIKSNIKQILNNCNKMGIKYLILPLVDQSSIKNKKEENILYKYIKNILKNYTGNTNILFESDFHPSKLFKFIEKFNSKKVGINYDTGNSASLDFDINDEIEYFNYVKNIHIKDRLKNGSTVALGKGNWNYKKFSKAIRKIKYKGSYILQTARSKTRNDIEELIRNRNFLIKIL